jgi:O-acetyl-ADP-ribose deacetylase (regulator of RNase III)
MNQDASRLGVSKGDITVQGVDAIVNAAKASLLGGTGVDGAIHRAAGPGLLEECRGLGGSPTGEARITKAYDLPARFVIHTVGPVWHGGKEDEDSLLASCYRSSLELGGANGVRSIAFPAISCGVYRFPIQRAARIAIHEILEFLTHDELYREVRMICFDSKTFAAFAAARERALAAPGDV